MTEPFNEFEYFLHNLRLDEYEIKTYLALLEHGPQNYEELIKCSNVPFSEIHSTIKSLTNKGWVKSLNQSRQVFYPLYPEAPLRRYITSMREFYQLARPF